MKTDHLEYWKFTPGQKYSKGFLGGTSVKRTRELLTVNRNQLRQVTELITGHVT